MAGELLRSVPDGGGPRDFLRKADCPSCGAHMEWWTDHWRCPWSTAANRQVTEVRGTLTLACANELLARNDITAPIRGTTR